MKQITDRELDEMFCEMLDRCYPPFEINGMTYGAGETLKQIDPTAYRCGFNDWLDSELGETIWEKDGEYFDSDPSESGDSNV